MIFRTCSHAFTFLFTSRNSRRSRSHLCAQQPVTGPIYLSPPQQSARTTPSTRQHLHPEFGMHLPTTRHAYTSTINEHTHHRSPSATSIHASPTQQHHNNLTRRLITTVASQGSITSEGATTNGGSRSGSISKGGTSEHKHHTTRANLPPHHTTPHHTTPHHTT
jgi:hypothetical protein